MVTIHYNEFNLKGQANPQLLQLISQHQQEFINLLNEPVQTGNTGGPAPGGPGPQYIQVTAEEKAAIDRLEVNNNNTKKLIEQSLGFDRQQVIEAFFACDKDETLAANYLLEHQGMCDSFCSLTIKVKPLKMTSRMYHICLVWRMLLFILGNQE